MFKALAVETTITPRKTRRRRPRVASWLTNGPFFMLGRASSIHTFLNSASFLLDRRHLHDPLCKTVFTRRLCIVFIHTPLPGTVGHAHSRTAAQPVQSATGGAGQVANGEASGFPPYARPRCPWLRRSASAEPVISPRTRRMTRRALGRTEERRRLFTCLITECLSTFCFLAHGSGVVNIVHNNTPHCVLKKTRMMKAMIWYLKK